MNIKKKSWILFIISLFCIFSFSVLFTIGFFSNYLINKVLWIVILILLIISTSAFVFSVYLMGRHKRRRGFKKALTITGNTLVSLYGIGCLCFLFILYGPINNFRDWLITTAMGTMNHQYYCKWFYKDTIINKVLGSNYVDEIDEDTDMSMINKDDDKENYEKDYEKELFEHNERELYNIVKFQINGQDAYMAAIFDPSRITVGLSKFYPESGQYVSTMAKAYNAPFAVNGGGFYDPNGNSKGGTPMGITFSNGRVITGEPTGTNSGSVIGFTNKDILILKKNTNTTELQQMGVRDAVTMGPFLIVNGKPSFISGNGGWGYAARTAIGQRADGIVLFLVVDSNATRTKGASMLDLTQVMQKYGAINAANLDGGTSSVMAVDGEIINDPIDSTGAHKTRGIPTIFMVK